MKLNNAIVVTGGIGTGKSTACHFIKEFGFDVIDADVIARDCLEIQKDEVIKVFGNDILDNGVINRKLLGKLIFNDYSKKQILEHILHPLIREKIYISANMLESNKKYYFIDIPLFFEANRLGNVYDIDTSLLIYTDKDTQIKRVMSRDNIDYDNALLRIESQLDMSYKCRMATYIIDNIYDKQYLKQKIKDFVFSL